MFFTFTIAVHVEDDMVVRRIQRIALTNTSTFLSFSFPSRTRGNSSELSVRKRKTEKTDIN